MSRAIWKAEEFSGSEEGGRGEGLASSGDKEEKAVKVEPWDFCSLYRVVFFVGCCARKFCTTGAKSAAT